MQFLVIDTLKFMLRNIRVNIIVIVTLLFAYLAFFLGCSYIEDGIRDFDTFQLKEMDSSIDVYKRQVWDTLTGLISLITDSCDSYLCSYLCLCKPPFSPFVF